MADILVADDEVMIREMLARHLKLAGHTCHMAADGTEARRLLSGQAIDVALLDVMMPGEDGFSLAQAFVEKSIPVLFLTARTAVSDRVYGLRLGADDYILKPFEPAELLARIDVILRRSRKNKYCDALLTVDFDARTVLLRGQAVSLTAMEFDLLARLLENEGAVMSREKLLSQVWGWEYTGETRTVDVHVQRLRAKLGGDTVETVYKRGYRYTRRNGA
ncbi:MAG: response regulator transcription factor [Clostridiales bacterium]|nr:response regulator transcription factor [Clostridiales bacterium]